MPLIAQKGKYKMATKRYNFKFHCIKDADVIDRLEHQDNMQDYIRLLIKSDILADSIELTMATPEQEQDRERAWQDYYDEHCKVFYSACCNSNCEHFDTSSDAVCTIEEDFAEYWEGVKDHGSKN